MTKPLPTPNTLRKLLRYEPETGRLFWREATAELFENGLHSAERKCAMWNGKYAGREALTHRDSPERYAYGDVMGVKVYAHRAIMAILTGDWPEADVDHINGDKTDNREENLRVASRRDNMRNRSLGRHNKSGVMGVYWDAKRQKWAAEIHIDGLKHYLGRHETFEEAKRVREEHEKKHGFHANHGRVSH